MFTIEKIEGTTVTVVFDKFSKRLQLPNAPVDDKAALLQFCSDRERAYDENRTANELGVKSTVMNILGTKQKTLSPVKVVAEPLEE